MHLFPLRLAAITALAGAAACSSQPSSHAGPLATVPIAATAARTASCPLPEYGPGADYHPTIDPASFSPDVTNPYFPLVVGRTLVYTGTKDAKAAVDVQVTTNRTRVVDGVTTRVIEDRLYLDGLLSERTTDYYAQDRCGNAWYFGEDTAMLDESGHVIDTAGSFRAGVDGAQPGVFMTASSLVGQRFRQEWFKGQAEDTFEVLDLSTDVTVPYGAFHGALRTSERTALEPEVLDNKYYVRGIGTVLEVAVRGPKELLRLVGVIDALTH